MDRLLRRIREGLGDAKGRPYPAPLETMPDATPEALLDRFRTELERVGGRFFTVPDEAAARALIRAEEGEEGVLFLEDGTPGREVAAARAGVDRADHLIAETGTVVRSYESREASRISLAPAASWFLATPDQLVPGLSDALDLVAPIHREGRAYTVLVTGPSRTADIEKELVIPAHGPRELVVVLIG